MIGSDPAPQTVVIALTRLAGEGKAIRVRMPVERKGRRGTKTRRKP